MITSLSKFLYRLCKPFIRDSFSEEGFISYTKSIQWLGIARFGTLFISLITTIIVARILGPDNFGTLNYILSLNVIFSVIANLGIDTIVYRDLVSRPQDREAILGSAMTLKFITGCIAILSSCISLYFLKETPQIKLLAFILSLSYITQPFILLTYDFLSRKDGKYSTITQVLTSLISNTLKIIVVFLYASIFGFIVILVIENLIAGSIYLYHIKKTHKRSINLRANKKEILLLLQLALPLTLSNAFSEIYSRIDQIMLKHYIDEKAVGLYAAAVRLSDVWNIVPTILFGSLFPSFVNTINKDSHEYKKRVHVFLFLIMGILSVIAFATFFLSHFLIGIVYGTAYFSASPLLSIYIFSLFGTTLSMFIFQDLFLRGKAWLTLIIPFFTAIINITLNLYLIPTHGALGAAFATAVSYNITPLIYLGIKKIWPN